DPAGVRRAAAGGAGRRVHGGGARGRAGAGGAVRGAAGAGAAPDGRGDARARRADAHPGRAGPLDLGVPRRRRGGAGGRSGVRPARVGAGRADAGAHPLGGDPEGGGAAGGRHVAVAVPDAGGGAAPPDPAAGRGAGGGAAAAAARRPGVAGEGGTGRRRGLRAGAAVPPADGRGAQAAAGGADPGGRAGLAARGGHPCPGPGTGTRSGGGRMSAVAEPMAPGPAPGGTENIVGDRTLVAVQAVNISRLSTHPVPTVPGTLIVVAGQGPKDSNGAGKSSFIAAITALLGDEQWRFASGARAVAELLFNAELAAQGDSQWASADHGYIIGVFDHAEPGAGTEDGDEGGAAGEGDGALTVWLRVNADAPHLEIRWRQGVHLASAPSEAERVALADRLWAGLPRSAGRRDLVAKDLSRVLYGGRVRCVSFLSTSVRSKVATNLLSQPLNEIGPERIFSAIAALTGLDRELEAERRSRAEEHRERAKAAEAAERLAAWEREAATLLAAFDRRDRARDEVAAALRHWRTRQARLLVDAAEADAAHAAEQERLRREGEELAAAAKAAEREMEQLTGGALDARLGEAEAALAELKGQAGGLAADKAVARDRLDELRRQVAALEERRREADGRDAAAARAELAEAEARRDEAQQELGMATGAAARAERS